MSLPRSTSRNKPPIGTLENAYLKPWQKKPLNRLNSSIKIGVHKLFLQLMLLREVAKNYLLRIKDSKKILRNFSNAMMNS